MSEHLSNGHEALVYLDGENHVVRIQTYITEHDAITNFINLEIASLLFPKHFIKVVELRLDKRSAESIQNGGSPLYVTSNIKSELAPTHPDHSIYSKHQKVNFNGPNCYCEVCSRHRSIHDSPIYNEFLNQTVLMLEEAGLSIPKDDSSDHCIGPEGIIFFETHFPDKPQLRSYLKAQEESKTTRMVNALLDYQNMMIHGLSSTESYLIVREKYPDLDLRDYSVNS